MSRSLARSLARSHALALTCADRTPVVLDEALLRREHRCALLVQAPVTRGRAKLRTRAATPAFLARHPFLMVGTCIGIAALALLYVIVAGKARVSVLVDGCNDASQWPAERISSAACSTSAPKHRIYCTRRGDVGGARGRAQQ